VNDLIFFEIFEGIEKLNGKPSDEAKSEPLEIVEFEEIIEIYAH
jgi:hypothetical protein